MMIGLRRRDAPASQREVDQLGRRIDDLDQHGTRGTVAAVGVVQTQLAEVIKDMGRLEGQTAEWQKAHTKQHEQDLADRAANRKWVIGTVIAILALLVTILAVIVPLALRGH